MMVDVGSVYAAIAVSGISVFVWSVLMIRMVWFFRHHHERRPFILAMPVVGLVASIGTLASAIGYAVSAGVLDIAVSRDAISLIASMGRGGLLMGGVMALAYYRPAHE